MADSLHTPELSWNTKFCQAQHKWAVHVQASGVRQGYRLRQAPPDATALCQSLAGRFGKREESDIDRVHRVVGFAEHDGCLTRHLLEYFGETREPCGHCGECEGIHGGPLPPAAYHSLGAAEAEQVSRLGQERHDSLAGPRQLTRFLCGLTSPATTRAKLRTHSMFGVFQSTPFHEVLALVNKSG